ncbi:MAG: hypothetical protein ACM33T_14230 [Solirubrobacterales bacterium]
MRSIVLAALAVLAAAPAVAPALADEVSAVQAVRKQSRVVDTMLDNGGNLYVAVKPTAGAWDQFGAYLCNVVRPHHARIFRIRVIDLTSMGAGKPPAAWRKLAEANCGR